MVENEELLRLEAALEKTEQDGAYLKQIIGQKELDAAKMRDACIRLTEQVKMLEKQLKFEQAEKETLKKKRS